MDGRMKRCAPALVPVCGKTEDISDSTAASPPSPRAVAHKAGPTSDQPAFLLGGSGFTPDSFTLPLAPYTRDELRDASR